MKKHYQEFEVQTRGVNVEVGVNLHLNFGQRQVTMGKEAMSGSSRNM